jgi:hypothetical protein
LFPGLVPFYFAFSGNFLLLYMATTALLAARATVFLRFGGKMF